MVIALLLTWVFFRYTNPVFIWVILVFCGFASIGFLDDLFVTPAHRSGGTAAALITAVQAEATAQGWGVLRWITRDNNCRTRGLYDKLA